MVSAFSLIRDNIVSAELQDLFFHRFPAARFIMDAQLEDQKKNLGLFIMIYNSNKQFPFVSAPIIKPIESGTARTFHVNNPR